MTTTPMLASSLLDMEREAKLTVTRLADAFGVRARPYIGRQISVPMGIEVEVRFHAFFPEIHRKYLSGRSFDSLDPAQKAAMSMDTSRAEEVLLPLLQRTVECGVPRGADRYWEFALNPCADTGLITQQLALLRDIGAIPSGYRHSLQITLGGLEAGADTGVLLFATELLHGMPSRIGQAFKQFLDGTPRNWAAKGRGGIFQKGGRDLIHGYGVATELRTLELPDDLDATLALLDDVAAGAEILHRAGDGEPQARKSWDAFKLVAYESILSHGLPIANWRKPHQEPEIWERYIEVFDALCADIRPAWQVLLRQEPEAFLAITNHTRPAAVAKTVKHH
jgi:hypothetical protein